MPPPPPLANIDTILNAGNDLSCPLPLSRTETETILNSYIMINFYRTIDPSPWDIVRADASLGVGRLKNCDSEH